MREFLAKIVRLAFGKGAAFCYAVTVGVSGQAAYNYLKPPTPAPTPVAVAVPAPYPAPPSGAAVIAPIPGAPPETTASPSPGFPAATVAAPIPLLPSAGMAEVERAAIPVRPGPGSGGLY
ncbi:MAG: hypothetical protein AB7H90_03750 [Alphaproteobacteria bacterium]